MAGLVFTHDKTRIRRFCLRDKILFGYHLGDLNDIYFDRCQYGATYAGERHMQDLGMMYDPGGIPTWLLFQRTEHMRTLIDEWLPLAPPEFYCHYNDPAIAAQLEATYVCHSPGRYLKMGLDDFRPSADHPFAANVERLNGEHAEELTEFYGLAFPSSYWDVSLLDVGRFVAIRVNDRIIAVAGTHVFAPDEQIAMLGGIAVDPGYRDDGIGTLVTSALVSVIREDDPEMTVGLNVKADNQPAIRVYAKLGFGVTHEYWEARFART